MTATHTYLELVDEANHVHKFYEVIVAGQTVVLRFGRLQTQRKG